eukprot:1811305-Rhodomonas_salina.1
MDGMRSKAMTSRALRTKDGRDEWCEEFTKAAKEGRHKVLVELVEKVFQRLSWRQMVGACTPGSKVAAELVEAIHSIRSARDAGKTMRRIATLIKPKNWKRGTGDIVMIAGASGAAGGEASSAEEGQE